MKYWIVIGLLLVGLVSPVIAQEAIIPSSSLVINFDFARYRNTDSTDYLELYFACFPQLTTLKRTEGGYWGFLNLSFAMNEKESGRTVLMQKAGIPVSIKDTTDPLFRNTLVSQMGFIVDKGSYQLVLVTVDSLAPSRRDSLVLDLTFGRENGLSVSDLELCSNIKRSTNTSDAFYKNSYEVVPNPTLLFGTANYPVVFHYLELYGLDPGQTYTVKTVVADNDGKPLQENSRARRYGFANAVEVGTTNVTKLPSGKYRFQIYVLSAMSQPLLRTEKSFYTYNPQEQTPQMSEAEMRQTELSGLTLEELNNEFDVARYYATQEEVRTFTQLSSEVGKREFLGTFWSQIANGKMGHFPITRTDYLNRVKKTTERYRALSRDGWKTDRGRVYLLYGEPDEIDRRPSNEGGKPYETWNYYQIENGVVFVFVDRTGFGDYLLVHSTKRGELRDDDWQRLLQ